MRANICYLTVLACVCTSSNASAEWAGVRCSGAIQIGCGEPAKSILFSHSVEEWQSSQRTPGKFTVLVSAESMGQDSIKYSECAIRSNASQTLSFALENERANVCVRLNNLKYAGGTAIDCPRSVSVWVLRPIASKFAMRTQADPLTIDGIRSCRVNQVMLKWINAASPSTGDISYGKVMTRTLNDISADLSRTTITSSSSKKHLTKDLAGTKAIHITGESLIQLSLTKLERRAFEWALQEESLQLALPI